MTAETFKKLWKINLMETNYLMKVDVNFNLDKNKTKKYFIK